MLVRSVFARRVARRGGPARCPIGRIGITLESVLDGGQNNGVITQGPEWAVGAAVGSAMVGSGSIGVTFYLDCLHCVNGRSLLQEN